MKRVKLKRELTPPGGGEPTQHVLSDWTIRHEDRYEIHVGGKEWHVGVEKVQSLTDTEYPFDPVDPDEDTRDGGYGATQVKCPTCSSQFAVSPDIDTGLLTCYECNNDFYGHLHVEKADGSQ